MPRLTQTLTTGDDGCRGEEDGAEGELAGDRGDECGIVGRRRRGLRSADRSLRRAKLCGMIPLGAWLDRTWSFTLPVGAFPAVVERLRGTPARAEQLIADVSDERLRAHPDGKWSAKQHLGHLNDLHELDERRLNEFVRRAEILTAADMTNRRTHEASHDTTPAAEIVRQFRASRHRVGRAARRTDRRRHSVRSEASSPRPPDAPH